MTVEELYWKLKALRDAGHSTDQALICTNNYDGEDCIAPVEGIEPEETMARGKYVLIFGDES
jgi:hypothetical protein